MLLLLLIVFAMNVHERQPHEAQRQQRGQRVEPLALERDDQNDQQHDHAHDEQHAGRELGGQWVFLLRGPQQAEDHGGKIHQRGGGTERGAEQNILPQRGEQSIAAQHDAGQHDLCGKRRQNEPLQTAGR